MAATVIFNGYDLTQNFIVGGCVRELAVRNIEQLDVPGMDGALLSTANYAPITISMAITYAGDAASRSDAFRELARELDTYAPAALSISDDGGKYYLAVPSGGEILRFVDAEQVTVSFACLDPVMYGEPDSVEIAAGETTEFEVGGTYRVLPEISVESASADQGTGFYSISIDGGTFDVPVAHAGSAIEGDCATRTLSVGGEAALPTLASDWPELEPGSHTATVAGTGACTLSWTERWL